MRFAASSISAREASRETSVATSSKWSSRSMFCWGKVSVKIGSLGTSSQLISSLTT